MDSSLFFTSTVASAIVVLTLLRKVRFHQEDNREEDSPSSLSPSTVPQPSSSDIWTHDVFPSFRGADVRRTFLSHIQMEFERKGITPFVDNEIRRGESIGPELIKAIRESKIAIILLSRNYASSKWCLDELVEIMKCREELGQTVLAIFYEVDPSDVKKLAGDFGRVFRKTCAGKTNECIERWRKAFAKVATIAGYHSGSWDNEAAMIKKIATDISNRLNNFTPSNDFDGLVAMGARLKKMEPLLCLDSDEVRMIGIWGPPGIGKTTIARAAYSKLSNNFQLSVFMDDLKANYTRLCSDDYSLKLQLQQQFMSQITNQKDMVVSHLGVASNRLKDKKVLVVLDGVDRSLQLDAIAKEPCWFGPGSRIIITTQDQRLFKAHGVNLIYKVDFPTDDESLQIFCTYSFGQKFPKDGFEELALEVTKLAGELPLGLRVMGSYFRGMSKDEWITALPRLRTSLDADIRSILKFSYDALDDEDKDLFLHIACFVNSEWINKAEEYLGKKFLEVRQRLKVLAKKSLISIDWGVIRMHSLLEKLGREIVCKQSIHEPGQRQFLCDKGDISEVLTGDATGSTSVIGIKLEYGREDEEIDISEKAFEGMSNLQFLKVYGYRDSLQLTGGLSYISHKLRLLHWKYFPVTCFPWTVNLEFLVEVIMPHSKLEKLWGGIKSLRSLKRMDLSDSVNLKELPELSTATNLEKLNLRNCSSLIKLPSLNGNSLEELDIGGCSSLVEFPSFIGNTVNLRILDLRYCSSLISLPSLSGNSLEKLEISGCSSLVEFPSCNGNAVNLRELDLSSFPNILELPSYVGNATNLEKLDLSNCLNLVELPVSLGNLQKLQRLILKGCSKLEALPTNVILESLKKLDLAGCSSLDLAGCSIIGNAVNLRELDISSLPQLLELPSIIGKATNLEKLDLRFCSNLVELPLSLGNLQKLQRLILKGCSKLEVLPANINLESLNVLNLCDCSMLTRFPQVSTNIIFLDLIGTAIEQVPPSITSWPRLEELKMSCFENLQELPHALERITELCLTDTKIQEVPPWVKKMSSLNRFVLMGCRKLVSVPPISDSISSVDASDCESLEILECSFPNPKVRLNFANCFKLNQEARDLIIQNSCRYAVLPGGEVPEYFTHRATGGGPLTIKLNENPLPKSMRFIACILLVDKGDHDACFEEKSTEVFCQYNDSMHMLHPALAEHLYIFRVKAEVTSSELRSDFKLKSDDVWKIGECGLVQDLEIP
ncbi:probable disease resistance protein RPP1 [Brassica napus]|uniref:probable disease resistance protein RPP1 n=1 Tax=Brassica napus TaxID=3708 RepID=UPI0020789506|nr:probable disease resistance protein RPP1 [Brassica napus]